MSKWFTSVVTLSLACGMGCGGLSTTATPSSDEVLVHSQSLGAGLLPGLLMERAVVALEAVPRKVEQQQVLPLAVGEKDFNLATDLVRGPVDQFLDLEVADGRVGQHARQGGGVLAGRQQLLQGLVAEMTAGDDQRQPATFGRQAECLSR